MTKEKIEELKKIYLPFEGKIRPNQKVHEGDRYGRWTVLYRTKNHIATNSKKTYFLCECDCGNIKEVFADHLRRGSSRGCGRGDCHNKSIVLNQTQPIIKEKQNKIKIPRGNYLYKYVENNEIVYIGKSQVLDKRIHQHTQDNLKNFKGEIYYFNNQSKADMDFLEYVLINKYHPKYNIALKNLNIQTDLKEPEWTLYKGELK